MLFNRIIERNFPTSFSFELSNVFNTEHAHEIKTH